MSTRLYIKTTFSVPGVGTAVHLAELEEINAQQCRMLRMIALGPNDAVMGAATPHSRAGGVDLPQETVPHPDTYENFPDIDAVPITAEVFDGLWSEASALYSGIN